jgi:uncharacterized membrane protein YphA (DoxX/SURF4 family)
MNKQLVGYWSTTALVVFVFGSGAVMDLTADPHVLESLSQLGYPAYLALLLGAWKLLGAIAISAPGLARVKEWAYAGMAFDLTGAAFSHVSVGDSAGKVATPLVLLGLVIASWALRPASRTLSPGSLSLSRPDVRTVGREPLPAE